MIIRLLGKSIPLDDVPGGEQMVELLVKIFQRLRGDPFMNPNDHLITHPTVGMKYFVEVLDLLDGTIHVVGDGEEVEVGTGNEAEFEDVVVEESSPGFPIEPIGTIHQDDRHDRGLSRLEQCEHLESLVHRAKASGEKDKS